MQKYGIFIKIKQFFVKFYNTNKRLFFVFVGLIVVVISGFCFNFFNQNKKTTKISNINQSDEISDYAGFVESKIEKVLKSLDAVKKVNVFVVVESSKVDKFLTEIETSKTTNGGTETETKKESIVFQKDGSTSSPVVVETVNPKITGVLICINKIDASTKVSILNSLSTVLNIDSSCISILQDR